MTVALQASRIRLPLAFGLVRTETAAPDARLAPTYDISGVDMSEAAHIPLTSEELDEAERLALIAAVEEALADPRPDIPHEVVRAEMLAEIEELEQQIRAAAKPAA